MLLWWGRRGQSSRSGRKRQRITRTSRWNRRSMTAPLCRIDVLDDWSSLVLYCEMVKTQCFPLRRYLYMEVDSMDQQKCAIPWHHTPTADTDSKCHIATVATNVRVPGVCCVDFLSNNNFPHDSNLAVTCVHR